MIELFEILGKGTLFIMSAIMFATIAYLLVMDWEDWQ